MAADDFPLWQKALVGAAAIGVFVGAAVLTPGAGPPGADRPGVAAPAAHPPGETGDDRRPGAAGAPGPVPRGPGRAAQPSSAGGPAAPPPSAGGPAGPAPPPAPAGPAARGQPGGPWSVRVGGDEGPGASPPTPPPPAAQGAAASPPPAALPAPMPVRPPAAALPVRPPELPPAAPPPGAPDGGLAVRPPAPAPPPPIAPAGHGAAEGALLERLNAERARAGLPALALDPALVRSARTKSRDMVEQNYFGHTSPTYGSPFDLMRRSGARFTTAAENIARGGGADQVHAALMASPNHRANLLNPRFTRVGIGVVAGGAAELVVTQHLAG